MWTARARVLLEAGRDEARQERRIEKQERGGRGRLCGCGLRIRVGRERWGLSWTRGEAGSGRQKQMWRAVYATSDSRDAGRREVVDWGCWGEFRGRCWRGSVVDDGCFAMYVVGVADLQGAAEVFDVRRTKERRRAGDGQAWGAMRQSWLWIMGVALGEGTMQLGGVSGVYKGLSSAQAGINGGSLERVCCVECGQEKPCLSLDRVQA
jgi:hypothetical protein